LLLPCLQDVEFAFERSRLKEWVADIKMLVNKDLRGIPGWGAHTRCAQFAAGHTGLTKLLQHALVCAVQQL
jgi:hypothetical protein